MNIDSINNGFVIDHITAGRGMKLYNLLGLDELDCTVAIIKNVNRPNGSVTPKSAVGGLRPKRPEMLLIKMKIKILPM